MKTSLISPLMHLFRPKLNFVSSLAVALLAISSSAWADQTKADNTYTKPFLFRIAGRHRSLILRNISYHDPLDDRYLIHLEGRSDIPDLGNTPADVESLVIDGLHLQDAGTGTQKRPYIRASGRVRRMVVRNSELFCAAGKQAVFLATEGDLARIDHLAIYNVVTENLATLVSDPGKKIGQLETSNVVVLRPA